MRKPERFPRHWIFILTIQAGAAVPGPALQAAAGACYIACVIRIAAPAWEAIAADARRAAPEEACGILVGRRGRGGTLVVRAEPCANVHPGDRTRHFLIDPEKQLAVQRQARREGLEIVGFYHTHPGGGARPSAEDAALAHPGMVMLIAALEGPAVAEARAWRFAERGFVETPLRAPA